MSAFLGRLEHVLERELVIRAPRELVFRYFTDSARFARWWGVGSTIEGRVGGRLRIVYPGGTAASGEVLELRAPEWIVFSYGYEGEGQALAPGASRVLVALHEHADGTRLSFRHELADPGVRDAHVQGWRYHLAVFATVVASEAHAGVGAQADRWFAAWNEPDERARRVAFEALAAPEIAFHDAYGATRGLDDLVAHVRGARMHMAGLTLERVGEPRQCQGTALVDWRAQRPDGGTFARGTSVLDLGPDGRLRRVVGFFGPP